MLGNLVCNSCLTQWCQSQKKDSNIEKALATVIFSGLECILKDGDKKNMLRIQQAIKVYALTVHHVVLKNASDRNVATLWEAQVGGAQMKETKM